MRATWDDFISLGGFNDGSSSDERDWQVRDELIRRLNNAGLKAKGVPVVFKPHDRPGMHNSCLIAWEWTFGKPSSLPDYDYEALVEELYRTYDDWSNSGYGCPTCGVSTEITQEGRVRQVDVGRFDEFGGFIETAPTDIVDDSWEFVVFVCPNGHEFHEPKQFSEGA